MSFLNIVKNNVIKSIFFLKNLKNNFKYKKNNEYGPWGPNAIAILLVNLYETISGTGKVNPFKNIASKSIKAIRLFFLYISILPRCLSPKPTNTENADHAAIDFVKFIYLSKVDKSSSSSFFKIYLFKFF